MAILTVTITDGDARRLRARYINVAVDQLAQFLVDREVAELRRRDALTARATILSSITDLPQDQLERVADQIDELLATDATRLPGLVP